MLGEDVERDSDVKVFSWSDLEFLRFDVEFVSMRDFWGSELHYAPTEPGQDPRHVGGLEPLWNMFDLTPDGRPNADEQFRYPSFIS